MRFYSEMEFPLNNPLWLLNWVSNFQTDCPFCGVCPGWPPVIRDTEWLCSPAGPLVHLRRGDAGPALCAFDRLSPLLWRGQTPCVVRWTPTHMLTCYSINILIRPKRKFVVYIILYTFNFLVKQEAPPTNLAIGWKQPSASFQNG